MQVQTNVSYPFFSNPYTSSTSPSSSEKETSEPDQLSQIKNDFNIIAQDLSPAERRLYNNLIYSENYQAARGIVTVGFMRAAGLYQDIDGNPLSGESLSQDLTRLQPPSARQEQAALIALQNHLSLHPSSLALDKETRGNLLDLRI